MSESTSYVGDMAAVPQRTERQAYLARLKQLDAELNLWLPDLRLLANQVAPGSIREVPGSDRQKQAERPIDVINGTPLLGQRTMAAGMMSGLTSPSRPWLKLTLPDSDLAGHGPVAEWLTACEKRLFQVFARSRIYRGFHQVYAHLGFGFAAMCVEEDPQKVIAPYVWPIGSYRFGLAPDMTVDTTYRRFSMSVAQTVREFGMAAVSDRVQSMWKARNYDAHIEILRVIEPNELPDPERHDWAGMGTRSVWLEMGGDSKSGALRRKGYHEFPVMTPRWNALDEDAYARGVGLMGLGDAQQLQHAERRKLQMLDKMTQPSLNAPAALRNERIAQMPGETNFFDQLSAHARVEPVYVIPPAALDAVRAEIAAIEMRLKRLWYFDLWLALSDDDRKQPITAREVAERHEEKLFQMGPALESVHGELLDPTVARTLAILVRRSMPHWIRGEDGVLPLPPEELHGQAIRVEYISIIAQAQKLAGITSQERLASVVGNVSAKVANIIDKIDWDKWVELYAESVGADPKVIVPQERVEEIRRQRAQAAQQQQVATEQVPAAAQAAKVLSETDMRGDNALNRLMFAQGSAPGTPGVLPAAGRLS